jgi:hypothetical protein
MYYLYLKESPLGLKYLGKFTVRKNRKNFTVYDYLGSGKIWKQHILKHGFTSADIKTKILLKTADEGELKKVAKEYSDKFLVAENSQFANMVPEDGANPCKYVDFSKRATPEYRQKISKALTGKPKSEEHKANMKTFEKGRTPWNKGITGMYKQSTETLEKRKQGIRNFYDNKLREELDPIIQNIILDKRQLSYKQIQNKYNLSYEKLRRARKLYSF